MVKLRVGILVDVATKEFTLVSPQLGEEDVHIAYLINELGLGGFRLDGMLTKEVSDEEPNGMASPNFYYYSSVKLHEGRLVAEDFIECYRVDVEGGEE